MKKNLPPVKTNANLTPSHRFSADDDQRAEKRRIIRSGYLCFVRLRVGRGVFSKRSRSPW